MRRLLQGIVLAGLPVAAACDGSPFSSACVETHHQEFTSNVKTDPPFQLEAESCRVDIDACMQLCVSMLRRAGISSSPDDCDVTFSGDEVTARITYETYGSGPGCPTEGRRPEGLVEPGRIPGNPVGAWFARAAWLEAASIHAFLHLANELKDHGAPRELQKLAVASARDEIRHTAIMTALARKYGAEPPKVEVVLPAGRSLEAIAIENAAEGCVRETWGAVIALWQAQRAQDAEARAAFTTIARDEVRHAALAWAIDRWATARLDDRAQIRVALAREAAVKALRDEPFDDILLLGLPAGEHARQLLGRTCTSLWNGGLS